MLLCEVLTTKHESEIPIPLLIFAQIHRSSSRWQLPAIAALSRHLYHLSRNLGPDEARACGIRPYCPLFLAAQKTGIGHIFHPLSYLALIFRAAPKSSGVFIPVQPISPAVEKKIVTPIAAMPITGDPSGKVTALGSLF